MFVFHSVGGAWLGDSFHQSWSVCLAGRATAQVEYCCVKKWRDRYVMKMTAFW